MKNYPPEFKADAVALYQSRPEATIRQVAADLGINPETLRNWVRAAGASRPRGRRAEAPAEPRSHRKSTTTATSSQTFLLRDAVPYSRAVDAPGTRPAYRGFSL
ncbi:transposase [Streptomyces sp. NPDC057284]|uniref:transposase n=1 Tax=Streptomyces sp. NPDC057284 TaxID=3346083 RepID=UPI0036332258